MGVGLHDKEKSSIKAMSWGHGAVQRTLLEELQKQRRSTLCRCYGSSAMATILHTHRDSQHAEDCAPWPMKGLLSESERQGCCSGGSIVCTEGHRIKVIRATLSLYKGNSYCGSHIWDFSSELRRRRNSESIAPFRAGARGVCTGSSFPKARSQKTERNPKTFFCAVASR
jgi:hypothetical protein